MPDGAGQPRTRLLDARAEGLDEPGLRARARELAARAGAPHASRSYRYPYALLAWHEHRVGVDIERVEPLDPDFVESICTPSERRRLRGGSDARHVTSLWCSKEALAKALGDAVDYDPRRLDSPLAWPDGRSGAWRARELPAPGGHVAWLCWRCC